MVPNIEEPTGANEYAYPDSSRSEVMSLVPPDVTRVLDIGCAWGGFGAAMKAARPAVEVWGIEANEEAARSARDRLGHLPVGRSRGYDA